MALSELQRASYADRGHLTVEGVFRPDRMAAAIDDAGAWGATFQAQLDAAERAWYLDRVAAGEVLRKLDNPVHERPLFRGLATEPVLLDMVANLIGPPAGIVFSQIFFKPPEGGGAKPAHQDNFYFGPDDRDGLVTAWIALDDATRENGCLWVIPGSHVHGDLPTLQGRGVLDRLYTDLEQLPGLGDPLPLEAPAGSVVWFDGAVVHGSQTNHSDRRRPRDPPQLPFRLTKS